MAAPNSMVLELVTTRFQTLIEQVLAEVTGIASPEVELVVQAPVVSDELVDERRRPGRRAPVTAAASRRDHERHPPSPGTGWRRGPALASQRPPPADALNPRYTFEAFVIGASNRFAHAAAQRVAEEPAKAYNPLFIYGPPGWARPTCSTPSGITSTRTSRNLNVCYVSTETFLNEFIDSIRTRGQTAFKRRYRAYDILLVDDIQLLEGKKETQEEFFYTFNSFYETDKQIVISSDRHPRAIATLEDRLRSRFESGLITDIQPPNSKPASPSCAKNPKAKERRCPRTSCELIATHVKDNIRELEGALITAFRLRQHPPSAGDRPTRLRGPL